MYPLLNIKIIYYIYDAPHLMVFSQRLLPLILKIAIKYLYSDLVNPLWDFLPEHDINFKSCNSITL